MLIRRTAITAMVPDNLAAGRTRIEAGARHSVAERQIIVADRRMQRAFLDKDLATLDSILTDDYILVLSDGSERTKAQVLRDAGSLDSKCEVSETSAWDVKIHGSIAIIVATLHRKGVDNGKAFDSHAPFCDIYILERGRWRNFISVRPEQVPRSSPSAARLAVHHELLRRRRS